VKKIEMKRDPKPPDILGVFEAKIVRRVGEMHGRGRGGVGSFKEQV